MPNPIFDRMRGSNPMASRFSNMVESFNQFRSQFQGNPEQQVKNLIDSGQMSKEQFEQLSGMARQFQSMFGRR